MINFYKRLRQTESQLNKYVIYIFAASIFLLHIPYYSLLPFATNLTNSYTIARIITLLLFSYLALSTHYRKHLHKLSKDILSFILLFLLLANGLSIITASRISAFASQFEDIVFGVLFYANCYIIFRTYSFNKYKPIIIAIIISTAVSIIDEFLLLINPPLYIEIARHILHSSQLEFLSATIFRDRLFVNRYNEIFIPIFAFLIYFFDKRFHNKVIFYILMMGIIILAVFSGWRIRLITGLLGIIALLIVVHRNKFKYKNLIGILGITTLVFLIIFLGNTLMKNLFGYSTVGRLILENKDDLNALTVRLDFFQRAIYLFQTSPITGIGIGQYKFIADKPYSNYYSLFPEREIEADLLSVGPHNIFFQYLAETGIIGIVALCIFVLFCLIQDSLIMRGKFNNKNLTISLIISFWSLFLFALFHTEFGFQFYALLFGLRAGINIFKDTSI